MPDQKVVEYIKAELQKGTPESKIKADLSANGWMENDIILAFNSFRQLIQNANISSPVLNTPNTILTTSQNTIEPNSSKNSLKKIILASVFAILLLVAAGITYAFIAGIGPFGKAPYSEDNLISGILFKISGINSASYKVSGSVSVLPREEGVIPFKVTPIDDTVLKEKFMRDYYRSQDITNIMNYLRYSSALPAKLTDALSKEGSTSYYSGYRTNTSLNKLNVDPLTKKDYEYSLSQDGKDFQLKITFETKEAIEAIKKTIDSHNNSRYYSEQIDFKKNSTQINGQTVTFNKSSDTYFYLTQRPPETFFEQLNSFTQYIPSEFNISMAIGVKSNFDAQSKITNWLTNVDAKGDFGDLSYKFNADLEKQGEIYYLKVNNFPSILGFDFPKNEWMRIDPKELASSTEASFLPISVSDLNEFENNYKEERDKVSDLLKRVAKIADEEKVLVFQNKPQKETVSGENLYKYNLKINKDNIISFFKKTLEQSDGTEDAIDKTFPKDIYLEKIESQQFKELTQYLADNSDITLWVDKNGFIRGVEYKIKIATPDENGKLKEKEIMITWKLELNDINKSSAIEAPKDAKSILEVFKSLYGGLYDDSSSRGKQAQIKANLASIRAQAEIVYDQTGKGYGKKAFALGPCAKTADTLFANEKIYQSLMTATDKNISKATCASKMTNGVVDSWAISTPYPDDPTYNYCVDSTGNVSDIIGKLKGYSCSQR